jgi:RHS repeat-associated protein
VVVSGAQSYTDTYLYTQDELPLELLRQSGGTTTRYWYVLDGRNNVVALTSLTGTVVDSYGYDLWGEPLPGTTQEQVVQPFRYAGYWYDWQLQWYWVGVRYYDPEAERWVQPDPSQQDGVRTYVYVGDDPVDGFDPLGFSGFCDVFLIGGAACGLGNAIGTWWNAHTEPVYAPASEEDLVLLEQGVRESGTGSGLSEINALNVAMFSIGGIPGKTVEIGLAFVGERVAAALVRTGVDRAFLFVLKKESRWGRILRSTRTRLVGRSGESTFTRATGIVKNTRRISVQGRVRIPDAWDEAAKVLYEVKNVRTQSYTQQLRDVVAWAKANDYTVELWTRNTTILSGPLEDAIRAGDIKLTRLRLRPTSCRE